MARKFKTQVIAILLVAAASVSVSYAQVPPPPPGGGTGHGAAGNQGATQAPIGNGIEVFLAFSLLYAGKKFFENRAYKEE